MALPTQFLSLQTRHFVVLHAKPNLLQWDVNQSLLAVKPKSSLQIPLLTQTVRF